MSDRVTLPEVAQLAGVSIATVSRVLNGLPAKDDTRSRVLAAVAQLDYVADSNARSLRAGQSDQIAYAVPDVGNPIYVKMMHAVEKVVSQSGRRLVLSSIGSDPDALVDLVRSLNRGYADGLVLTPLRVNAELIAALRDSRLPIAVVGTIPDDLAIDSVRADSRAGIRLAVDHLRSKGRQSIAYIGGPADTGPGAARLAGYLEATQFDAEIANPELLVEARDFTHKAGEVAAEALLAQSTPDAIICANDLLAVGALRHLRKRGVSVPDDIALIGVDDTDAARLANPSLTSVKLRSARRARVAAELLMARIADRGRPVQHLVIEPGLAIRESTGGPS
jgi:LacI family transcriptional regulator